MAFKLNHQLRFEKKEEAEFSTQRIIKQQSLLPQGVLEAKGIN